MCGRVCCVWSYLTTSSDSGRNYAVETSTSPALPATQPPPTTSSDGCVNHQSRARNSNDSEDFNFKTKQKKWKWVSMLLLLLSVVVVSIWIQYFCVGLFVWVCLSSFYLRQRLCRACYGVCVRHQKRRCPSWSSWDRAACEADAVDGPSHSNATVLLGLTYATWLGMEGFIDLIGPFLFHLCTDVIFFFLISILICIYLAVGSLFLCQIHLLPFESP